MRYSHSIILSFLLAPSFLLASSHPGPLEEESFHRPTQNSLASQYNCSLKLAVKPTCTSFRNSGFGNANSGIDLRKIKNVVPFGDSWTAMNDSDGTYPPPPAVIIGTNPMAGERGSNGPTWTEYVANDTNALIHPYAVGGAVTNLTLWPTAIARQINISSFVNQTKEFFGQNRGFDSEETLYIIFFGINDYTYSLTDGADRLLLAANTIYEETLSLITSPTVNAKNILTANIYFSSNTTPPFSTALFQNLSSLHAQHPSVNTAFVDYLELWDSILSNNATAAEYGYTNTSMCLVSDSTTVGACDTPETYLYWQHAHPSTCTHRLMADYTEFILENC